MTNQYDSVKAWFDVAPARFQPSRAGNMNTVVQFDISGEGGGKWYVTVKDKTLTVSEGEAEDPAVTVTMAAGDWLKMVNRQADVGSLYMSGRLQVKGSIYLAQQFAYLFA